MKGGGSSGCGTYCKPNMSLKYFHFAQFYGFEKMEKYYIHIFNACA